MQIVYRALNAMEANLLAAWLNANGVETFVAGQHLQSGAGELAAMDYARVHVKDENVEQALELIREYEANAQKPDSIAEQSATKNHSRLGLVLFGFAVIVLISLLVL